MVVVVVVVWDGAVMIKGIRWLWKSCRDGMEGDALLFPLTEQRTAEKERDEMRSPERTGEVPKGARRRC